MNVFKCLPRFGASLLDWHQSVRHNLHSTGLENNLENSACKKSTKNYFINTSLTHWWAPESFHAVAEDRASRGEADWSWYTVAQPPSLRHAPPYRFPPTPSPTPEPHPLSSWAIAHQAWPRRWPNSCCFTSSICLSPLVPVSPQLQTPSYPAVIDSSPALLCWHLSGVALPRRVPFISSESTLTQWLWPVKAVTPGATRGPYVSCPRGPTESVLAFSQIL